MSAASSKKTPLPPAGYRDDPMTREVLRRVELMSPRPSLPHGFCAGQLHGALWASFNRRRGPGGPGRPGGWVILAEPELHLEQEDPIVPDIAGWLGARMPLIPRTAAVKIAPDWVCEVLSPSTEAMDRTVKLDIYGTARVGHVWLVDPLKQRVEVYALASTGYRSAGEHAGEAVMRSAPFESLALELADIWPAM